MTVVGHQFITLIVHICVQHGGVKHRVTRSVIGSGDLFFSYRQWFVWFVVFACPNFTGRPSIACVCVCVCVATSTGHADGVHNKYQGACYYHNMKLTVRVCCRPSDVGQLLVLSHSTMLKRECDCYISKCPKWFGKRPHRRSVTPRDCKLIRPI